MDTNTLALLGIAAFNAFTAFMAYRTHAATLEVKTVAEIVKSQTDGINSRLEAAARLAQEKADTATSKLADAKIEVAVITEKLEVKNGKK